MLIGDIFFMLILFGLTTILFLVIHTLSLRLYKNINLLYFSALAATFSILIVSVLSYFLFSHWFSSFNTFVVSLFGSALATIFAAGFYTFLGPATADRSLTTHLFVLLYNEYPEGCTRDDIMNCLNAEGFIEKRLNECKKEKFISEHNGVIKLTEKGKRTSKFYMFMLDEFNLRTREGYVEYFKLPSSPNGK